jgi:hypothetical protein
MASSPLLSFRGSEVRLTKICHPEQSDESNQCGQNHPGDLCTISSGRPRCSPLTSRRPFIRSPFASFTCGLQHECLVSPYMHPALAATAADRILKHKEPGNVRPAQSRPPQDHRVAKTALHPATLSGTVCALVCSPFRIAISVQRLMVQISTFCPVLFSPQRFRLPWFPRQPLGNSRHPPNATAAIYATTPA